MPLGAPHHPAADGPAVRRAADIGRPVPPAAVTHGVCLRRAAPAEWAWQSPACLQLAAAPVGTFIAAYPLQAAAVTTGPPALRAADTGLRAAHPAAGSNN